MARAVVAAGLAPTAPSAPLSVRLHKAYDADLVATRHGYRIYCRTLLGSQIDWAIVSPGGITYHHALRRALLPGVHDKIRMAQLRAEGHIVDAALCRKLGFCDAGVRSFCSDFGLDPSRAYATDEIASAVRDNPTEAGPYLAELRALADQAKQK